MAGKRGNNEGSIKKRGDGRWEARLTLPDGRRQSLYGKTRQEAARLLAAATRDRDRGLLADGAGAGAGRLTVGAYLADWLAAARATLGARTWRRYAEYVRVHATPALGATPLVALTPRQVQRLYAEKLAAGLSPTTVHHLHAVLHKALHEAVRQGLAQRNVCALVDPPRMARPELRPLTPEQARRLLAAAAGDPLEALYALALDAGMRQGELLGLRWRDVDLDAATVQVRATLQRVRGQGFILKEPKTPYSRRKIRLRAATAATLRAHRDRQLEARRAAGAAWEDRELVFADALGGPLEGTAVTRTRFYALLRRVGLPRVRFHDLRHTCATLLLLQGVNPKIVSERLGHASVRITLDTYSHVLPDMQDVAAAALDAALGG